MYSRCTVLLRVHVHFVFRFYFGQSALSSSFTPVDVPRVSPHPPAAAPVEGPTAGPEAAAAAEATPTLESAGVSTEETWKADYEVHVAEWRVRSAEQREKAEAERARGVPPAATLCPAYVLDLS